MLDICELFIQCNKDSCCEHITVGVNIYLYGCVSLLAPECAECLCVCEIKSEHQQNITLCVPHQMWHNHPFSQRNKTTERTLGVGVGGHREWGG